MFVNVFATNKYLKIHLHWKTHLFGKEHASAIGSTTKIRRVLLENPTSMFGPEVIRRVELCFFRPCVKLTSLQDRKLSLLTNCFGARER